jgi:hypothetical protein
MKFPCGFWKIVNWPVLGTDLIRLSPHANCQCQWWMNVQWMMLMRNDDDDEWWNEECWLVERGGKENKIVVCGLWAPLYEFWIVGRSSLFRCTSLVSMSKSSVFTLLPYNFWWIDWLRLRSMGHPYFFNCSPAVRWLLCWMLMILTCKKQVRVIDNKWEIIGLLE